MIRNLSWKLLGLTQVVFDLFYRQLIIWTKFQCKWHRSLKYQLGYFYKYYRLYVFKIIGKLYGSSSLIDAIEFNPNSLEHRLYLGIFYFIRRWYIICVIDVSWSFDLVLICIINKSNGLWSFK